ncbi:MAG: hypothetical protein J6R54_09230 [Bacteroidaceae bacterium]|nr:hypothetical protein [Bacteroidaceae bacterium]
MNNQHRTNMTPQEKAQKLAEAVKYCLRNNLLLPQEKELLEKGSKEERFKVMCKAMLRKDLHEQRQGKK